jgi:hypothetical protein
LQSAKANNDFPPFVTIELGQTSIISALLMEENYSGVLGISRFGLIRFGWIGNVENVAKNLSREWRF